MEEKKKLIQFKNIVKSFEDGQVVLKGVSLEEGATAMQRNSQIGGHKA